MAAYALLIEGHLHPSMRQDMQTAIEKINFALGLSEDEPARASEPDNAASFAELEGMMRSLR